MLIHLLISVKCATSQFLVESRKSLCWLFISSTFLGLVLQDNLFQSNKINVLPRLHILTRKMYGVCT